MRRFVLIVLLTVSACAAASAAQDGQHWEALGPWYTDTRIVAVGPGPNGPVFESAGGSVMWSEDGGRTWSRYGMPPKESVSVYGFVPDDAVPGALFITTYHGVFHSPGAGKTWEALSGGVGFDGPFVRGAGDVFYGCSRDSVYRSPDGGRSWQVICDPRYLRAMAVDPTRAGHLMVGSGPNVLTTWDDGLSWASATPDTSSPWSIVGALCLSPAYPEVAYAATRGLFRSADGGRTWSRVPLRAEWGLGNLGVQPSIATSAKRPSLVLVSTDRGLLVGREDGQSLTPERPEELKDLPIRGVAVNADATLACAATATGIYVSRDGGETWSVSVEGFRGVDVDRLSFLGGRGDGLITGTHWRPHGGTWTRFGMGASCSAVGGPDGTTLYGRAGDKLAKSTDFGRTWQPLADPRLTSSLLSVTYAHGAIYVPGFYGPIMRSGDDGKTWQELPLHTPRSCYLAAVRADPLLPDHIYVEVGLTGFLNLRRPRPRFAPGERVEVALKLIRSEDNGKTWLDVPPTDEDWRSPERYAVHVAGSAAPGEVLYAAPLRGFPITNATIARSLDGGKTWEAFGDQTPLGSVGCLAAEPPDTHTAYAGCGVGRPAAGRIFVTRDSGRTWEQLGPDLDTSYIGDLLVRPGGEAALYVATGKGVQRLALPELGVGR